MIVLLLALLLESQSVRLAEQAYHDGRYDDASQLFLAALEEAGSPSGTLLYDLGNCAELQGRHAEAIWYYRRAERHLGIDADLDENLRLSRERLGLEAAHPDRWHARALRQFDALSPSGVLLAIAALQALALIGLLRTRGARRAAMAVCLLLSWVGAARLVQQQSFPGPPEAVVLAPSSAVHDEPHESTAVEFELRAGQIVHVVEESDRWLRVQHPAGRGWVRSEGLGRVD